MLLKSRLLESLICFLLVDLHQENNRKSIHVCLVELFEEAIHTLDAYKVFGALSPGFLLHSSSAEYQKGQRPAACVRLAVLRTKGIRRFHCVLEGLYSSFMSTSSERVESHQKSS